MFFRADNVPVSIVVQIFDEEECIINEEEHVAENAFVCVNKFLETDKEIIEECEIDNNSATG